LLFFIHDFEGCLNFQPKLVSPLCVTLSLALGGAFFVVTRNGSGRNNQLIIMARAIPDIYLVKARHDCILYS